MEPTLFDEFTKALATSTTRRAALRRIGGILGGAALAGVFPGLAFANNRTCAHFCAAVFGANTPAAEQCTADAAHGTGLCSTCGSNAAPSSVCCTRNSSGFCSSYSGATCCTGGQTCQNGTCFVCANPASDICNVVPGSCGVSGCFCVQSVEGGVYCADDYVCGGSIACASDSDCVAQFGSDHICMNAGNCGCSSSGTTCAHISSSPATCFSGCFIAGTLIAMADGTSRPIEDVHMGDTVVGHEGHINRVVAIKHPVLGERSLYALNNDSYFVTDGHPFLTEDGWKSIDPAATARENPAMQVARLTIGDHLLSLTGAAIPVGGIATQDEAIDVRVTPVMLHSITSQPADTATQLYNLQLDGDHTYFANDLLVHNK